MDEGKSTTSGENFVTAKELRKQSADSELTPIDRFVINLMWNLGLIVLLCAGIYGPIGLGFIMPEIPGVALTPSGTFLAVATPFAGGLVWTLALIASLVLAYFSLKYLKSICTSENWKRCAVGAVLACVPLVLVAWWLAPGVVLAGLAWGASQYFSLRKENPVPGSSVLPDQEGADPHAQASFKMATFVVFLGLICGAFVMMCPHLAIPVFLGLTAVASKWVFAATVALAVPALFGLLHTVFLAPRPADARSGFKHVAWLSLLSVLSSPLIVAACMAFLPAAPGLATAMAWVGGSGVAQFFGVAGIVAGFSVVLTAMGAGVRALQAWLPESSKRWRMVLNVLGGMMMLGAPAAVCTWVVGPALGLISWISTIPSTFGAAAAGLGVVFGGTGLLATLIGGLSGLWQRCGRQGGADITTVDSNAQPPEASGNSGTAAVVAGVLGQNLSGNTTQDSQATAVPPFTPKRPPPSSLTDAKSSAASLGSTSPSKMAANGLIPLTLGYGVVTSDAQREKSPRELDSDDDSMAFVD